ncbi:hypothetical protein RABR111495_06685 [Rahnella bruchi]
MTIFRLQIRLNSSTFEGNCPFFSVFHFKDF